MRRLFVVLFPVLAILALLATKAEAVAPGSLQGRSMTFYITFGGGNIPTSGAYHMDFSLVGTNFTITPLAGYTKRSSGTYSYTTNSNLGIISYHILTNANVAASIDGEIQFTMGAPLGNPNLSSFFNRVATPLVAAAAPKGGTNFGRFILTDTRFDLNHDGNPDLIFQATNAVPTSDPTQPTNGAVVWLMSTINNARINVTNGVDLGPLYIAAGESRLVPVATTESVLYLPVADPNPNWKIVAQADLNGDGNFDLVWQNQTNYSIRIWYLTTNTVETTEAHVRGLPPYYPVLLRQDFLSYTNSTNQNAKLVGLTYINPDFTNVTLPDFVFQTTASLKTNSLFFIPASQMIDTNTNPTNFTMTPIAKGQTFPPTTGVVGLADLNSDGWPDIIFQHQRGSLFVWYMRDNKILGTGGIPSDGTVVPISFQLFGTADFNHDGQMDVLFRNQYYGNVGMWYLRNQRIIGGASFRGPVLGWKLVGPK